MTSPYQTPQYFEPAPPNEPLPAAVSWLRVLLWAAGMWLIQGALWTAMTLIAISSFHVSPEDILNSSSQFTLIGQLTALVVTAFCYAVLAFRSPVLPALHVSLVLLVLLASDAVIEVLVFQASLLELRNLWDALRSAAAAIVGYAIARTISHVR